MKKLSAYVHIPFCASKCAYCDFLSFSGREKSFQPYTDAIVKEINQAAADFANYETDTVFFGGGTPTLLTSAQLLQIFNAIKDPYRLVKDAEVSVEANPETVTLESLSELKRGGFNRLSMGVQSFDDGLLTRVGRIHTADKARQAYAWAREAGFDNINLDLMFSLPGQDLGAWERTLKEAAELGPEHLSCYSLTVEPATRLGKEGFSSDEDLDREMYKTAKKILTEAGYEHYEISNFAKPGYRSRHNIIYWTGYEYRGFGLGAHSLTECVRWHNDPDLDSYIRRAGNGRRLDPEPLYERDLMSEFMFLGLRLTDGINCKVFLEKFDKNIYEEYGAEIKDLTEQGLLESSGDHIRLTEKGLDLANIVFVKFI